jgi:hypothetical protein
MRSLFGRFESWWEITRLNREIRGTSRKWRRLVKEGKTHEDDDAYFRAIRDIEDQIDMRLSNDLVTEAHWLKIPTPRYSDGCEEWRRYDDGALALRTAAFKPLRDQVREERKMRFEAFSRWVTLIGTLVTMLVGLTGALIGLVSVWRRR